MSIEALTQAKSTLEGVRGALGIYSKTEVDMTLGMLGRAIANYADLDAICQDLQEKTYTQAMRIAELEAKLAEAEKKEPVAWAMLHDNGTFIDAICPEEHARLEGEYKHPLYTHPQPKREPVALRSEQFVDMARAIAPRTVMGMKEQIPNWIVEFARAIEAAHGIKEKNT